MNIVPRGDAPAVCARCQKERAFLLRDRGVVACLFCTSARLTRRVVRLVDRSRPATHFAVVHVSTQAGQAPWQVSWFDDIGAWGHTCRDTIEEAIEVALRDGYVQAEDRCR